MYKDFEDLQFQYCEKTLVEIVTPFDNPKMYTLGYTKAKIRAFLAMFVDELDKIESGLVAEAKQNAREEIERMLKKFMNFDKDADVFKDEPVSYECIGPDDLQMKSQAYVTKF
jgi:hypothetical protein